MTKKALIGTIKEIHYLTKEDYGRRVHQIEDAENIFPVAEPHFTWVDCPDDVDINVKRYGYKEETKAFIVLPQDISGPIEEPVEEPENT